MNCYKVPSLQHLSAIKLLTAVMDKDDVKALFSWSYSHNFHDIVMEIMMYNTLGKIRELALPESLRNKLICLLTPITLEAFKWLYGINRCLHGCESIITDNLSNQLYWTSFGTIDDIKTAQRLIANKSFHAAVRCKLACIYCLEDETSVIRKEIPEPCYGWFHCKEECGGRVSESELVPLFWANYLKSEITWMIENTSRRKHTCTDYQCAINHAVEHENRVAVEYFFSKLTPNQRVKSLVRCAKYVKNKVSSTIRSSYMKKDLCLNIFRSLLSQVDEELQMTMFEDYPLEALMCFLVWPWQHLFIPIARRMLHFLPKRDYVPLLEYIVDRVISGYRNCNYDEIFKEFWLLLQEADRKFIISNYVEVENLLCKLFYISDRENIDLIMQDATSIDKEKIIFSMGGLRICMDLITGNQWDALKYFIGKCLTSKESVLRLPARLKGCFTMLHVPSLGRDTCEMMDQLINDIACTADKKRSLERAEASGKKLCV